MPKVNQDNDFAWATYARTVTSTGTCRPSELALRGGRYAIRTRDPQAATLTSFAGVPTFAFDEPSAPWLTSTNK